MTIDEMKIKLEGVLTPRRYMHSINVMNTAVKLAEKYGESCEEAGVAGLLHDCARNIGKSETLDLCGKFGIEVDAIQRLQPELLHGPLGVELAKHEYGITNEYVLNAIKNHTTGCENMSILAKIIFIADYIEPGRECQGVDDIRKLAFENIDDTILAVIHSTINYIITKERLIHPDTLNARNYIISQRMKHFG